MNGVNIMSNRFYEAARAVGFMKPRVENRESFDIFSVDLCYHKSCYIKYTIDTTGKSEV